MHVFVIDTHKKPLSLCHPGKARQLLKSGRASVFRHYPFTIILHDTQTSQFTWGRQCADCGAENVSLEVEPIQPKCNGGSDRVSNLTLACHPCNPAKGNRDIREFLSNQSDLLNRVLKPSKTPRKDTAGVNRTPWKLYQPLTETGLTVETGTGGLTKYNRTRLNLPKMHGLEVAYVGQSTRSSLKIQVLKPLQIQATGRGTRQRILPNKYGFARGHRPRPKQFFGFKMGDIVIADLPKDQKAGWYLGRVACRTSPCFNIKTVERTVQNSSHKYCRITHPGDGYLYGF